MSAHASLNITVRSARPELTSELVERTGLDETVIRRLVERFYDRAKRDPLLGPVFDAHIGDWTPHLKKMADFWSSVALMTGRYHGSPMHAHVGMNLKPAHFDRWLALFRETATETCPPAGATLLIERAERMAKAVYRAVKGASSDWEEKGEPDDPASEKETAMNETVPLDDNAALTRYIETRYHQRHRDELPGLASLAAKVEDVHNTDPRAPKGLAALLRHMTGMLEVHMKKEELILFPAIRRGDAATLNAPIAAMRADHEAHTQEIASIRDLTGNMTAPEGACRTWRTLYEGLQGFVADLEEHVRLENEVLFPRFENGITG